MNPALPWGHQLRTQHSWTPTCLEPYQSTAQQDPHWHPLDLWICSRRSRISCLLSVLLPVAVTFPCSAIRAFSRVGKQSRCSVSPWLVSCDSVAVINVNIVGHSVIESMLISCTTRCLYNYIVTLINDPCYYVVSTMLQHEWLNVGMIMLYICVWLVSHLLFKNS